MASPDQARQTDQEHARRVADTAGYLGDLSLSFAPDSDPAAAVAGEAKDLLGTNPEMLHAGLGILAIRLTEQDTTLDTLQRQRDGNTGWRQ